MIDTPSKPRQYRCPFCEAVSHNPNDIEKHHCGRCHQFADDVLEDIEGKILLARAAGVSNISVPVSVAQIAMATIRASMAAN